MEGGVSVREKEGQVEGIERESVKTGLIEESVREKEKRITVASCAIITVLYK